MAPRSILARSRYGWRWLLVLIAGISGFSIGCNPQTLSMFLLPFTDNKNDPEYKLFAADKEINLVVLSSFAHRQFNPDYAPADHELAEHVALAMRKRCQ